jgi:type I restriction enzyme S subunit
MIASGHPLVGDIPAHWALRELGQLGRLAKGKGGSKDDEVVGGVPCVRYGDLYTTHTQFIEQTRASISPERAQDYTRVTYRDALFAASGETIEEIGKSAVVLVRSEICCGGDVLVFRPAGQGLDARFLGYALDSWPSVAQKSLMGRGFTVVHIYASELKRLAFAVPTMAEQRSIVKFLDYTGQRIGAYLRAKGRLINLLNEQKQASIYQSVTRGLDPFVPVKSSGVDWLGDIPQHWTLSRSRRLFSVRKELAGPDDVQLSATQAYGVIRQSDYEERVGRRVVKISMHLERRKHVEKDDFVISMRSFQGGLERAWVSGAIRSSYIVLKPIPIVDVEFFSYLFKSKGYIGALQATADFIRDGQDLTYDNFRQVDLPLIPLDEQRAIAAYLSNLTAGIDLSISRLRRELDLIREFRTRLIADVVTGKLDVRTAAAALPDEVIESEDLTADLASHGLDRAVDPEDTEAQLEEVGE